jgi:UDP:flavonoid glycosyltransferase YjiC (YdhE family)
MTLFSVVSENEAEVGDRVARSGVGVHLESKAAGVEAVRGAVEHVLGIPTYQERARAMATRFSALDTPREIFSVLDRLIAEGAGMRG